MYRPYRITQQQIPLKIRLERVTEICLTPLLYQLFINRGLVSSFSPVALQFDNWMSFYTVSCIGTEQNDAHIMLSVF